MTADSERPGFFKRFFRRFSVDETDRRAATIRDWAEHVEGCTLVRDTKPREVATIAGVVESLRVRPREGVSAIEATVSDGTGTVTAVWLGRRTIPGLQLGVRMVLRGRLGGTPESLQLMNPQYEFAAPPEHR